VPIGNLWAGCQLVACGLVAGWRDVRLAVRRRLAVCCWLSAVERAGHRLVQRGVALRGLRDWRWERLLLEDMPSSQKQERRSLMTI